jgi:hypothetical protein
VITHTPDVPRPQTLLLERLIDHIRGQPTFNEIDDDSLSRFLRSGESGPFVIHQILKEAPPCRLYPRAASLPRPTRIAE